MNANFRDVIAADVAAQALCNPELAVKKADGIRISSKKEDAGYRTFCIAETEGKKSVVYLNGTEQKACATADERRGLVVRAVTTLNGNYVCYDGGFLEETVYGDVRIEFI